MEPQPGSLRRHRSARRGARAGLPLPRARARRRGPAAPGGEDRFRYIRSGLAARIGAADGGAALRQTRVVEGYRELTTPERRACCAGRFAAHDRVRGRSVLLIDDVVTSGAQASEAIRALEAAGARLVRFAAVAIAVAAPEDAPELVSLARARQDPESHTIPT